MRIFSEGVKARGFQTAGWLVVVATCLLTLVSPCGAAEQREWVDITGKFKTTASLKEVNKAGEAVLELANGTTRNVPLGSLSKKDRDYVAKMFPDAPKPKASPASSGGKAPARILDEGDLTNDEKWEKWGWKVAVGGLALVALGSLIAIVDAFCVSILLGIGSLLIPLVNLAYIATHWHRPAAARGGMLMLLGIIVSVATVFSLQKTELVMDLLKERVDLEAIPGNPFGNKADDSEG